VQTESPCSVEETFRIIESQTPRVLQLLRGLRQQRSPAGVLQRGHGKSVEVAQSPKSASQLHTGRLRRPIGPFPRATATDRSTEPSRITAPVFLCTGLTRIRVFLKSPVLENGTPGSVRGRFEQLAVLPRCQTPSNREQPARRAIILPGGNCNGKNSR